MVTSSRVRIRRRCGRGCLGPGGIRSDQREGGHHDEQFRQAHMDQVRVVLVVAERAVSTKNACPVMGLPAMPPI